MTRSTCKYWENEIKICEYFEQLNKKILEWNYAQFVEGNFNHLGQLKSLNKSVKILKDYKSMCEDMLNFRGNRSTCYMERPFPFELNELN